MFDSPTQIGRVKVEVSPTGPIVGTSVCHHHSVHRSALFVAPPSVSTCFSDRHRSGPFGVGRTGSPRIPLENQLGVEGRRGGRVGEGPPRGSRGRGPPTCMVDPVHDESTKVDLELEPCASQGVERPQTHPTSSPRTPPPVLPRWSDRRPSVVPLPPYPPASRGHARLGWELKEGTVGGNRRLWEGLLWSGG